MQRYVTRSYWSDGNVSVSRPMSLRNAERNADRMREVDLVREVEILAEEETAIARWSLVTALKAWENYKG
jgi:hypothetical protein